MAGNLGMAMRVSADDWQKNADKLEEFVEETGAVVFEETSIGAFRILVSLDSQEECDAVEDRFPFAQVVEGKT